MKVAIITTDSREHYGDYSQGVPYFGTAPEALLQGLSGLSNVEVHVISCLQQKVSSPEKLAGNIWYHGLHVPKFGWMRTGYQGCIRAVRRKLQEIQPDIVHGQGTERDCAMSTVFSGYPNVLTIHGNMQIMAQMQKSPPFSFYWLAAKLERLCLARTDGVVCITDYTRKAVSELARQTWTVPNAVDQSFFEIIPAPSEISQILYVGNICPRKNQNAYIRAMDELPEMKKRQIIFLGSKNDYDPYACEFDNLLSTRPWCRFEGFADRDRLKDYFSRASLLVLASLEDNCPMVVLEAMAAGVPVVASAVGGIPELIENGVTGLLCDPIDNESMRNAVAKIFSTTAFRAELANRARIDCKVRFHPLVVAMRHMEIYRQLSKKSRAV